MSMAKFDEYTVGMMARFLAWLKDGGGVELWCEDMMMVRMQAGQDDLLGRLFYFFDNMQTGDIIKLTNTAGKVRMEFNVEMGDLSEEIAELQNALEASDIALERSGYYG